MRLHKMLPILLVGAVVVTACSSDDASTSQSTPKTAASDTTADTSATSGDLAVIDGEAFPAARCEANKAAGKITYLTGFDFASASSIVEILVAQDKGYYEELCLEVEVKPGGSTTNYPLIAANTAQFASGGSFSEVALFSVANEGGLVATAVDGRTAIDSLIVKAGEAETLEDLKGSTIGVKFKLPPSIEAMLLTAGLKIDVDYTTVLLDGFDPLAHIQQPVVGFPGYKSSEPGILERAGIDFTLFDPTDYDVPGSYGAIYTNAEFIAEHPTAAEDFMRATMRGMADAIDDPDAAAQVSIDLINANGNPMFLQPEGEQFRWRTESKLIADTTPDGIGVGVPDPELLQAELDSYAAIGLYGDAEIPVAATVLDNDIIASIYDDTAKVIWPAP